MLTKLEEKLKQRDCLHVDFRRSLFLYNVLWPKQERLSALCYALNGGVMCRPERYLVLTNQDFKKRVIKFTAEQFKNSPIYDVPAIAMNHHRHPEIEIENFVEV